MSEKITPSSFPMYRPNPLLATLPAYLKDPANYQKVQKALIQAGATKHSHGEMVDWAACKTCQRKQWDRKEMMLKLGFKSGASYMAWKKTMETIKRRVPLR